MPRRLLTAVAVAGIAAALGGCGSSSSTHAAHPATNAFLAYSKCMRANGVPAFPDPSPGGGIQLGGTLNPFSPSFKAAQTTCHKLLPGGGPPSGKPSAQTLRQMVDISECMRAHGVSGFPDPTTTPPSSPPAGGLAEGRGGVFLIVPATIDVNSPAFKQAAEQCHFG